MAEKKYSFDLKNKVSELDTLCQQLEKFGQSIGLSQRSIFEINLALDELFTNIISYGFADHDEHDIKITITPQDEEIVISIEDDGLPFNPVDADTPNLECSIENCKIGGLGIHIIRKLMDAVCYQRCDNKNILTMRKAIKDIKSSNKKQKSAS